MPRNVRNFWVTTKADGVATVQATGPRAADGGFRTTVQQRDKNGVTDALAIEGHARSDGSLVLTIHDGSGTLIHTHTTARS